MKESNFPVFFKVERQNTDESLNAERDKANESLSEARAKTERITDRVVRVERLHADEKTELYRELADASREKKREIGSIENFNQEVRNLHYERLDADRVTEKERTRIDEAIEKERDQKNLLVKQFLEKEREQTDEHLSFERTKTDSKVLKTSQKLIAEVAEHLITKSALTTREEFIAIVSHDLRNPIGAASSCAEMLLQDQAYMNVDSEVRHWIQFIKRNVDISLRLISDLLDMERVAKGKLQLKIERVDIGQMILETIESNALTASAKSILMRDSSSHIHEELQCDRDRIAQVISNLVSNAIKFTPEGGSVTINANYKEHEVQVSIQDTGPGIPQEKQEHIFERFTQLGFSDRSGLGLGLHISKMFVEAHCGRIWVRSKSVQEALSFLLFQNKGCRALLN